MKQLTILLMALTLTVGAAQADIWSDIKEAFETAPDRIADKLDKDWEWVKDI